MNLNLFAILSDAYHFFIENLRQMAGLFLPILLVATALDHMLMAKGDNVSILWSLLVSLLLSPLYTGPLLLLLAKRTALETPGNGQLLRAGLALWWPLFILTFMIFIAVMFGFFLLIIPGIWIAVRLAFAEIYLVVEGLSPLAALRKSHDTTKEGFWIILLTIVCVYIPLELLGYLFEWWVDATGNHSSLTIISDTVVAFLELIANVAIFRIYLLTNQARAKVNA